MFLPISVVPTVSQASIQALCPSLNTPVLNIEQLPVGPARAVILLFGGDYGDLCLVVGLRSLETNEVVIFNYQGDPGHFGSPSSAVDAALSFSEGMGFLFDDDLIAEGGPGGRTRASQVWESLARETEAEIDVDSVGDCDAVDPAALAISQTSEGGEELSLVELAPGEAAPADAEDGDEGELLLEECLQAEEVSFERDLKGGSHGLERSVCVEAAEADDEWEQSEAHDPLIPIEDLEIEVAEPGCPKVASGEVQHPHDPALELPARQAGVLTKFRGGAVAPSAAVREESLPSIGQVPLVSMPAGSAGRKPNLLVRLLGSF